MALHFVALPCSLAASNLLADSTKNFPYLLGQKAKGNRQQQPVTRRKKDVSYPKKPLIYALTAFHHSHAKTAFDGRVFGRRTFVV